MNRAGMATGVKTGSMHSASVTRSWTSRNENCAVMTVTTMYMAAIMMTRGMLNLSFSFSFRSSSNLSLDFAPLSGNKSRLARPYSRA